MAPSTLPTDMVWPPLPTDMAKLHAGRTGPPTEDDSRLVEQIQRGVALRNEAVRRANKHLMKKSIMSRAKIEKRREEKRRRRLERTYEEPKQRGDVLDLTPPREATAVERALLKDEAVEVNDTDDNIGPEEFAREMTNAMRRVKQRDRYTAALNDIDDNHPHASEQLRYRTKRLLDIRHPDCKTDLKLGMKNAIEKREHELATIQATLTATIAESEEEIAALKKLREEHEKILAAHHQRSYPVKVHFDRECHHNACELLRSAEQSIYVAMAWLNDYYLCDELIKAAKRGVTVRLILDKNFDTNQDGNQTLRGKLNTLVSLRGKIFTMPLRGKAIMHHKFVIVDKKRGTTGSFNWTLNARKNKRENTLSFDDEGAARAYCNRFDIMRKTCDPFK